MLTLWQKMCLQRPEPERAPEPPKPTLKIGQRWRHRNGIEYEIYDFTNMNSTRDLYPPRVSYRNIANGEKYSRRCDDWHRSFELVQDVD